MSNPAFRNSDANRNNDRDAINLRAQQGKFHPVIEWENRWLIRPSVQGYNTREELDKLVEGVDEYIK